MKKLINSAGKVVSEMSEGFVAMHGGLALLSGFNVILRADSGELRDKQVAVISGGGSGHEPAHAGYVGAGMLSAAVAGEVFTSPSVDSIYAAITAVAGSSGVLLVVKNYTGDRLNFGLAAELARGRGIPAQMVVVADDIALAGTHDYAGARGIAGTVLVHKVAGAAAAEGKALEDVAAIARDTAHSVATMGVALSSGIVPAVGKPSFMLAEDEMELGLGIHGEPGVSRTKLLTADELASDLTRRIISAHNLQSGDRVAVLINNLGSTTAMELAIFGRAALGALRGVGLQIERVYSGAFMTSLEAAGVSLSVLRVDEDRMRRLDAPTRAPGWPNAADIQPAVPSPRMRPTEASFSQSEAQPRTVPDQVRHAIKAACDALLQAEGRLTTLDQAVGDGDLGISLSRGARSVEELLAGESFSSSVELLQAIALTLQRVVGGTSGPLYAVFLLRAANVLASNQQDWAKAALAGCDALSQLGGAKEGDRTMLDALVPFARELKRDLERGETVKSAINRAVGAAEQGAAATAEIASKRGRSSYLGGRVIGHPDPGAVAVAIWLRAVAGAL